MVSSICFPLPTKKTIFICLVLVWHVQPTHLMLHLVFLPLPKHQHCKVSYGIITWGIYIYMPSNKCKIFNWWKGLVGQQQAFQYVKDAYLANIMYQISPLNLIHVQQSYWSWYTWSFAIQCKHQLMVVPSPLLFSLMIIFNLLLFVSFAKNQMSLPFFKPIKHLWKIKLVTKSKFFALIMVMNLHLELLIHFVNYMELFNILEILTPRNKMEFPKWKNRTLMEFVQSMLQSTKLSNLF